MTGPRPIVITGPTGWIGTALLSYLADTRGADWAASVRLFGSHARTIVAPDGARIDVRALEDIRPRDVDGAIVIHLAYLTKEKAATLGDQVFDAGNLAIDDCLLTALASARPHSV